MLLKKETASRDQLPIKSQRPDIIKCKDRWWIMDVTWAIKGDIFKMRKMRVGLRGLVRLRRRAGIIKKRSLRRYVDNEKV